MLFHPVMKKRTLPVLLLLLAPLSVQAQKNRPIPYPVIPPPGFERALAQGTRSADGLPGPNYWTNTAEYTIKTTLSTDTRTLRGSATIRYHNNAPEALPRVAVHLRQNLHKAGAVRNRPQQLTGGLNLTDVQFKDAPLLERASPRQPGYSINGTVMWINLPEPIPAGGAATFSFSWNFEVPEAGAPRMGQDGEVFYLAYWYPQFAVFDDVNGWKADQYMGNGEFYMDYSSYDVTITLPEGWLVAATGVLQNPEAVLADQTRKRLAEASGNDEVVRVVQEADRGAGTATRESDTGLLSWHFKAENVRDFAFGTSDQYLWDATSARVGDRDGDGREDRSMIYSFYRPAMATWARSAEFAQYTIAFMSNQFLPYPYPHMTTVEGLIGGGMEFPMMTLIGGGRTDQSLFGVTFHEVAHMWFPMVVGQDEKQFTWMDEGLTSFNTSEGSAAFWNTNTWDPARQSYYYIAGTGDEVEPMRHGDQYPYGTAARGIASYNKPAVALNALRGLFGQERFYQAYQEYARRWAFKHPQPYDLFNTFDNVLGEDLDWFWTTMFFNTWTLDQAIKSVERSGDAVVVTIEDRGLSPMPVPLRVTYADGTVVEETVSVEEWLKDQTEIQVRFEAGTVERVEIDPGQFLPDVDRSNNLWVSEK